MAILRKIALALLLASAAGVLVSSEHERVLLREAMTDVATDVATDIAKSFGTNTKGLGLIITATLVMRPLGAFIFGRRTYEITDGWGGRHAFTHSGSGGED